MLDQAINIASIYTQSGKFKFTDAEDDYYDMLQLISDAKAQGYDF